VRAACQRPKTVRAVVAALLAALGASTACAGPSAVSFGVGVTTPAPWGMATIHTAVPLYPLYRPWQPMGPRPPPPMMRPAPMAPPPPTMRPRPQHWW
jgi:hypothetical protein